MGTTSHIERKFRSSSGDVYTKEVTEDGGTRYRKNGSFTSQQSFAGAAGHEDAEIVSDRDVTVPVPTTDENGDYDGYRFTQVDETIASRIGEIANDPREGETVPIPGSSEVVSEEDIQQAYRDAEQDHGQPVRGSD